MCGNLGRMLKMSCLKGLTVNDNAEGWEGWEIEALKDCTIGKKLLCLSDCTTS